MSGGFGPAGRPRSLLARAERVVASEPEAAAFRGGCQGLGGGVAGRHVARRVLGSCWPSAAAAPQRCTKSADGRRLSATLGGHSKPWTGSCSVPERKAGEKRKMENTGGRVLGGSGAASRAAPIVSRWCRSWWSPRAQLQEEKLQLQQQLRLLQEKLAVRESGPSPQAAQLQNKVLLFQRKIQRTLVPFAGIPDQPSFLPTLPHMHPLWLERTRGVCLPPFCPRPSIILLSPAPSSPSLWLNVTLEGCRMPRPKGCVCTIRLITVSKGKTPALV
ncbi:uncharacterized protein LOC116517621 isoform X2 [Thamnophis elegans]|uniref:uncharacterized protein LOC116517621 isoform X2 n=1 Tax=Thamnophis elegans TaxID=35005 RepID=UPI00137735FE|nr:uncharacterized protein LOC116517621 isoform X2 [Thamnophis elegans]